MATVGFDWERPDQVLKKVDEELVELREAIDDEATDRIEEELGDLLFALANLARHLGIEPEGALAHASRKFSRRFTELERRFQARRLPLRDVPADEMEREWARIKETAEG